MATCKNSKGLYLRLLPIAALLVMRLPLAQAVNITCVGDSITYGYSFGSVQNYPAQLQTLFDTCHGLGAYTVGNYGVNSLTLRNDGNLPYTAHPVYPASLASDPDVVVIMLGANDAKIGVNWNVPAKDGDSSSIDIYDADYSSLIDSYRMLPSAPEIFICTLVPVRTVGSGTDFGISGAVINDEMCPAIRTTITAPADVMLIEINATYPHDDEGYYIADKVHPNETGYAYIAEMVYTAIVDLTGQAINPVPADGATGVTSSVLSWSATPDATGFDVYIGTSQPAVANATQSSAEFKGTVPLPSYIATLADTTQYYWRIDTATPSTNLTGAVWSFTTGIPDIGTSTAISINFTESAGATNQQLNDSTAAGRSIYAYTNWNNTTSGATGTLAPLEDSKNESTSASVTWSCANVWGDTTADADASAGVGNARIARGYLDDGGDGINISVSGIPYPEYEVVVYFSTDHVTGDAYAPLSINGITNQTTGSRSLYSANPGWDDTDSVILPGLTNSTLNILSKRNGNERASIAGIQIIDSTYLPGDPVIDLTIEAPIASGTRIKLTWTGEDGKFYGLETNSNLIDGIWHSYTTGVAGSGTTISITNTILHDQTFYRVISE